tara:strand:+ start:832 stop:1392 length:561 start_codon:yes stop_codon:yes gene_type:complete
MKVTSNQSQSGFTLLEALVATVILAIGFVGTHLMVMVSERSARFATARQILQLQAEQIHEIIDSDLANLSTYTGGSLTSCDDANAIGDWSSGPPVNPTPNQRMYEWCKRMKYNFDGEGQVTIASGVGTTSSDMVTSANNVRTITSQPLDATNPAAGTVVIVTLTAYNDPPVTPPRAQVSLRRIYNE